MLKRFQTECETPKSAPTDTETTHHGLKSNTVVTPTPGRSLTTASSDSNGRIRVVKNGEQTSRHLEQREYTDAATCGSDGALTGSTTLKKRSLVATPLRRGMEGKKSPDATRAAAPLRASSTLNTRVVV